MFACSLQDLTRIAIERGTPGVYNIVDDDPAEVSVWLARLVVGDVGVSVLTSVRGSSNAKAKRDLGWRPEYASWREGFRTGLSLSLRNDICLNTSSKCQT